MRLNCLRNLDSCVLFLSLYSLKKLLAFKPWKSTFCIHLCSWKNSILNLIYPFAFKYILLGFCKWSLPLIWIITPYVVLYTVWFPPSEIFTGVNLYFIYKWIFLIVKNENFQTFNKEVEIVCNIYGPEILGIIDAVHYLFIK